MTQLLSVSFFHSCRYRGTMYLCHLNSPRARTHTHTRARIHAHHTHHLRSHGTLSGGSTWLANRWLTHPIRYPGNCTVNAQRWVTGICPRMKDHSQERTVLTKGTSEKSLCSKANDEVKLTCHKAPATFRLSTPLFKFAEALSGVKALMSVTAAGE